MMLQVGWSLVVVLSQYCELCAELVVGNPFGLDGLDVVDRVLVLGAELVPVQVFIFWECLHLLLDVCPHFL